MTEPMTPERVDELLKLHSYGSELLRNIRTADAIGATKVYREQMQLYYQAFPQHAPASTVAAPITPGLPDVYDLSDMD